MINTGSDILHDRDPYVNYGINLCETTDCTYAPSVADAWQNRKIGIMMNLNITGIILI